MSCRVKKAELARLTGADVFSNFSEQLKSIQAHYRRFPKKTTWFEYAFSSVATRISADRAAFPIAYALNISVSLPPHTYVHVETSVCVLFQLTVDEKLKSSYSVVTQFSGEEDNGKFVDLNTFYTTYTNLPHLEK